MNCFKTPAFCCESKASRSKAADSVNASTGQGARQSRVAFKTCRWASHLSGTRHQVLGVWIGRLSAACKCVSHLRMVCTSSASRICSQSAVDKNNAGAPAKSPMRMTISFSSNSTGSPLSLQYHSKCSGSSMIGWKVIHPSCSTTAPCSHGSDAGADEAVLSKVCRRSECKLCTAARDNLPLIAASCSARRMASKVSSDMSVEMDAMASGAHSSRSSMILWCSIHLTFSRCKHMHHHKEPSPLLKYHGTSTWSKAKRRPLIGVVSHSREALE
mmetsp:Transcript_16108/g.36984  ORF Transcript_16108/g.36984 Transcript_16108/m.36984 type:complete len:272 (+) Transcript_16108:787-1602(+)